MQCRENEVQATLGLMRESVTCDIVLFLSKIILRAENDFLKGEFKCRKILSGLC